MTSNDALDFIEDNLTEARTDAAIEYLVTAVGSRVRWLPTFIVKKILDVLLPETLVAALRFAFSKEN
jgi:hypothetical protein